MKKIAMIAVLTVMALSLTAGPSFTLDKDDYRVIKKAVGENPKSQPAAEVKWLRVLIVENASGKEKVKVTMPISLVEIFARCAEYQKDEVKGKGGSLNFSELLEQLKKAGPMAIVEINEEDETIKVWLE
ncbi:MAG: hypothetical protein PHU81_04775 [Acidobacteriota bacterium]|nr:hypothetical protein [Acidobacteriota bacterium]